MPILQYRFGHGIQKLRRVVDLGLAGTPYVANVDVAWLRGQDYYEVPWRGRWATELGGALLSHAVHALDMLLLVMGPPSAVFARTATLVNDIEVEDCGGDHVPLPDGCPRGHVGDASARGAEISRHRFSFEHLSAESGTEPYANGAEPWVFTAADGRRRRARSPTRSRSRSRSARTTPASSSATPRPGPPAPRRP